MCTATEKMITTINEYLAVKAQINQLRKAAEDLEGKIKSFMVSKDIDIMTTGDHTVTYKTVETAHLGTDEEELRYGCAGRVHGSFYDQTFFCKVIIGSKCEKTTESHFRPFVFAANMIIL